MKVYLRYYAYNLHFMIEQHSCQSIGDTDTNMPK